MVTRYGPQEVKRGSALCELASKGRVETVPMPKISGDKRLTFAAREDPRPLLARRESRAPDRASEQPRRTLVAAGHRCNQKSIRQQMESSTIS